MSGSHRQSEGIANISGNIRWLPNAAAALKRRQSEAGQRGKKDRRYKLPLDQLPPAGIVIAKGKCHSMRQLLKFKRPRRMLQNVAICRRLVGVWHVM